MNLIKSIALATLVAGLTMNIAMAADPWCGYAGTTTPPLTDKSDRNKDFKQRATTLQQLIDSKKCAITTIPYDIYDSQVSQYYKNAKARCDDTARNTKGKRDENNGSNSQQCLIAYNAMYATAWPFGFTPDKAKTVKQLEKEKNEKAVKACNDVAVPATVTANATPQAVCGCRNMYQDKTKDKTNYDANAKTLAKSHTSPTRTWLINTGINDIAKIGGGTPLVNALNCCQLLNGNEQCTDKNGTPLPN